MMDLFLEVIVSYFPNHFRTELSTLLTSHTKTKQLLLLPWRILNGRGLPNCMTELPSLKCLSSSLHSRDSHPFANVLRPSPSGSPSASVALLPSHVPSKNSFSNVLCLLMWPKYDSFCFLIRFKSCGAFTPSCSKTLAFVFLSVHEILSIFR